MAKPIVIVGAGVAGLVCARHLHKQGRDVLVLDASDRPGGRLKTDEIDGFRFDRGFQAHFTAYPAALAELQTQDLDLRKFAHGAMIWWNGKLHRLDREDAVEAAFCRVFGLGDKLRCRSLSSELSDMTLEDIWHEDETTSEVFLRRYGFSDAFIERFARPFWGGVFLDRTLSASSRILKFYWKTMDEGDIAIPARGMEAIPQQIAAGIPSEKQRMGATVTELIKTGGRVTGVKLASGETIEAESVVIATEPSVSAKLTGIPGPTGSRSTLCLYFEVPERLVFGNFIILNGTGKGLINEIVPVTNLSPEMAPAGKHMVSVTLMGGDDLTDSRLMLQLRDELTHWPAAWKTADWKLLKIYRIPHAQFPQPPGVWNQLQATNPSVEGLILAGEGTQQSSIQGALESGIAAATSLLQPVRELESA